MIIGIAGGIGSGKSTVAEVFKIDKFGIINADMIAAEVRLDPDIKNQLVKIVGGSLLEDGEIAKEVLLEAVLTDKFRPKINEIMHPEIKKRIQERMKIIKHEGYPDIVIDAPIFKQLDLLSLVDKLIFVKSNLGNRIMRIKKRKHYVETTISKLILIQSG